MAITDIFTIPTLISLGITLLLVGLVAMFFMQRLNEQNHKFASMLGLVTTMADELNYIRSQLQTGRHYQNGGISVSEKVNENISEGVNKTLNNETPLIDVSDDDDDEDDDDDDDDDDDESVASLDDESVESLDDDDDEEEFKESNIKKIDMGETLDTKFHCETLGEEDNDEPEEIQSEELEGDLESLNDDLEEDLDVDESDGNVVATATETHADVNEEIINLSNAEFIKSIDISNLEESHKDNESFDYKKMSLPKLKSLVVEKGLATDSSKLKKNELLKLLESE